MTLHPTTRPDKGKTIVKKTIFVQAVLLCLPVFAHAAEEGGIKAKAAACMACHGESGNKPIDPSYPKIGGQHKDYLVKVLRDYKLQRRTNPIMSGQVAGMAQRDIEGLATYFSSQKGDLTVRR